MPAITLPDGSQRQFDAPVTGTTVAEAIGPGLARAALAMKLDGKTVDLSTVIKDDARIVFITRRDDESLELIRHDAAHVLAEAVQSLFPGTQVTIGPSIENGFYYDFARNEPFTTEDFPAIEAKMREIVARGSPFVRRVMDREAAIRFFADKAKQYKAQLIQDLPVTEQISLYSQGEWVDLCRGPHMRSTADVGTAFKLMKVAGAYWRGDHRNAMLSRIYGTAWRDQKELDAHLHQLEEAERRDHRRIGKDMGLFHLQEEAAGLGVSGIRKAGSCIAIPRIICGGGWTRPAIRKSGPLNCWTACCGKNPATGTITDSICSSPRWRMKIRRWR